MRRILTVATLALVAATTAACASTGAGSSPNANPSTGPADIYTTGGGTVQVNLSGDDPPPPVEVGISADQAFATLSEVYGDLGIALTASDPSTRTVGNERFIFTRRLAGKPGSEWLRCGTSATGIPIADTYRVQVYIRTTAEPAAGGTARIVTLVQAFARTTEGTSNAPVRCITTGMLEREIATRVLLEHAGG